MLPQLKCCCECVNTSPLLQAISSIELYARLYLQCSVNYLGPASYLFFSIRSMCPIAMCHVCQTGLSYLASQLANKFSLQIFFFLYFSLNNKKVQLRNVSQLDSFIYSLHLQCKKTILNGGVHSLFQFGVAIMDFYTRATIKNMLFLPPEVPVKASQSVGRIFPGIFR